MQQVSKLTSCPCIRSNSKKNFTTFDLLTKTKKKLYKLSHKCQTSNNKVKANSSDDKYDQYDIVAAAVIKLLQ